MRIITHDMIKKLNISGKECYEWIDYAMKNRNIFVNPHKTRIPLSGTDYFNVMPCVIPSENKMGLKVVTRSEKRRKKGKLNLDSKIMLYSYDESELLATMDGNFITTMRTAAVAVHTMLNIAQEYEVIAMVGLGNIGTAIGDILFELIKDKPITVKLMKYKDHASRFIERFSEYNNIKFEICNTHYELMNESDVVFSSVTYAGEDFVKESAFKPGCTVIPVHMRGFMDCDLHFDHIITSDLESIKKFENYGRFKKMSLLDDVIYSPDKVRNNKSDRVIVYNLGLALHDIWYASKIYDLESSEMEEFKISPNKILYV